MDSLFAGAEKRYRDRDPRPATLEAEAVWLEAIEHRDYGWMDGPYDLTASGRLASDPLAPINIAPRGPVIKPGKFRAATIACDPHLIITALSLPLDRFHSGVASRNLPKWPIRGILTFTLLLPNIGRPTNANRFARTTYRYVC